MENQNNTDYPRIIINSIPAPELLHGSSERDIEHYKNGLKKLESFGADFLVIVCNTAYNFFDELQSYVNAPIINLVNELEKFLMSSNVKKITVFATKGSIKRGLYKFGSFEYNNLTEKEIKRLEECIFDFNTGRREKGIDKIKNLFDKYSKKSDLVILGCTEISLMLKGKRKTLDTMDFLVEATIKRF